MDLKSLIKQVLREEINHNTIIYEDEFGSVEVTTITESEYKGRKVQLGKIMQGDIKKFKVYAKNDK